MQRNNLKFHQGKLKLDIGNNFFMERLIKQLNRLPRATVEPSSLEIFKRLVDVALKDTVQRWDSEGQSHLDLMILKAFST